jgi:hypothetical protein
MRLYQELLDGAEVVRIKHLANGDIGCYYRIAAKNTGE